MQFQTLLKRGLAVGGGFLAGKFISDRLIGPLFADQFQNLDPIALDIGMALAMGGLAYFAYDMLPNRVLDGIVGFAGYSLIAPFMAGAMGGGSENGNGEEAQTNQGILV